MIERFASLFYCSSRLATYTQHQGFLPLEMCTRGAAENNAWSRDIAARGKTKCKPWNPSTNQTFARSIKLHEIGLILCHCNQMKGYCWLFMIRKESSRHGPVHPRNAPTKTWSQGVKGPGKLSQSATVTLTNCCALVYPVVSRFSATFKGSKIMGASEGRILICQSTTKTIELTRVYGCVTIELTRVYGCVINKGIWLCN